MSAVVAHEIANPLEAIHNLLFLIRKQADVSPEIVGLATAADEEASRVLTISKSALSFFRQSSEPELVDLLAAAQSVRLVLDPTLEKQQVAFRIESDDEATIEALAGETRQVLLNLVRNAVEASSPNSQVTVRLSRSAEEVKIVVADQGTGIPAEVLPELFQFGKSTKGERGNGMGLWTVKHILDRHQATIDVQSVQGAGTTFTIHWPVHFAAHRQFAVAARA
jgi:signal transduction histidine kinase